MNPIELDHSVRKLRQSGMAETLETRVVQAQSESMAPLDLLSALVRDEDRACLPRYATRHPIPNYVHFARAALASLSEERSE